MRQDKDKDYFVIGLLRQKINQKLYNNETFVVWNMQATQSHYEYAKTLNFARIFILCTAIINSNRTKKILNDDGSVQLAMRERPLINRHFTPNANPVPHDADDVP